MKTLEELEVVAQDLLTKRDEIEANLVEVKKEIMKAMFKISPNMTSYPGKLIKASIVTRPGALVIGDRSLVPDEFVTTKEVLIQEAVEEFAEAHNTLPPGVTKKADTKFVALSIPKKS